MKPKITSAEIAFLVFGSISTFGDTLLLFAVPNGLGLHFDDLRLSTLMWMFPAIAIFLSSYLSGVAKKRVGSSRIDYAIILTFIGTLEVLLWLSVKDSTDKFWVTVATSVFVLFYAFSKEGLPRLLVMVRMYDYFCKDAKRLPRVIGWKASVDVLASFLAIASSGFLIEKWSWMHSLIIDALTFFGFAFALWWFGSDVEVTPQSAPAPASDLGESSSGDASPRKTMLNADLKPIVVIVPLLFGLSALGWSYFPVLSKMWGVANVSASLILVAFLRLPGVLSGFYFYKIIEKVSVRKVLWVTAIASLVANFLFLCIPNIYLLGTAILFTGFVYGLYWPADTYVRNTTLGSHDLIDFNARMMRLFCLFQFFCALIAMACMSTDHLRITLIGSQICVVLFALWRLPRLARS